MGPHNTLLDQMVRNFQKGGLAEKAGDHETARQCRERGAKYIKRAKRRYYLAMAQRNAPVAVQDIRPLIATAVRPRERRDTTGRSSARSGDSPDDPDEPPATPDAGVVL